MHRRLLAWVSYH